MTKVHYQIGPTEWQEKTYGKGIKYAYCGDSTYCGDKLRFTYILKEITCLACVRDLFKNGEVRLEWIE